MLMDILQRYQSSMAIVLNPRISGVKVERMIKGFYMGVFFKLNTNAFCRDIWLIWNTSFWKINILSPHFEVINVDAHQLGERNFF